MFSRLVAVAPRPVSSPDANRWPVYRVVLPMVAIFWESLMIFRSLALTLCLALFCLGPVAGCAPAVDAGSSSGTIQATPATTVPPTDAPPLGE